VVAVSIVLRQAPAEPPVRSLSWMNALVALLQTMLDTIAPLS